MSLTEFQSIRRLGKVCIETTKSMEEIRELLIRVLDHTLISYDFEEGTMKLCLYILFPDNYIECCIEIDVENVMKRIYIEPISRDQTMSLFFFPWLHNCFNSMDEVEQRHFIPILESKELIPYVRCLITSQIDAIKDGEDLDLALPMISGLSMNPLTHEYFISVLFILIDIVCTKKIRPKHSNRTHVNDALPDYAALAVRNVCVSSSDVIRHMLNEQNSEKLKEAIEKLRFIVQANENETEVHYTDRVLLRFCKEIHQILSKDNTN
jgi:hypothetical protein